jgi:adenosylhomocysteine nucleosidase
VSVTGIVAALTAEARTLNKTGAWPDHRPVQTLPDGNLLVVSGMGPAAATQAAGLLLASGARSLLSFGLAGALDPALRPGTVLLPDTVIDGSGAMHPTFGPWRDRLAALCEGPGIARGTLLSVPEALSNAAAKSQARSRSGACAVDMESFAIGRVAAQAGVNFAVARVVVDTAMDTLPRSARLATGPHGEVNYGRLVWGLMRAPSEISALVQLWQRYRIAMRSLRRLGQRGIGWS